VVVLEGGHRVLKVVAEAEFATSVTWGFRSCQACAGAVDGGAAWADRLAGATSEENWSSAVAVAE
jgi:hypothetical protein